MADRIGWVGETRRGVVAAWLDTQLAAWWSEWSTVAAVPERVDGPSFPTGAFVQLAGRNVAVASEGPGALAAALVGVGTDQAGALARYVGEEALEDLVQRLRGGGKERSRSVDAIELPASLLDPRLGAVIVNVRLSGFHLQVYLARVLVDQFAPPAKSAGMTLESRRKAIGAATARLVASLDLGEIALSELSDLRPGDVIVTHAALETPAALSTNGAGAVRIAHAVLGEHGGRRALLLTHS